MSDNTGRMGRDMYFMQIAILCSKRSTCSRRQVGCVLVDQHNHIVATGYNGVPRNFPHCINDVPCPGAKAESGKDLDKCLAVHAEANAILQCGNLNQPLTLYTTTYPCIHCAKLIANTGIQEVIFIDSYQSENESIETIFAVAGIITNHFNK